MRTFARPIQFVMEASVRHKIPLFILVAIGCIFGYWCMQTMPLDALPDLGDKQVIIYSRWERSPDLVESQVTYPIVTAMLGAPGIETVRGYSDFGYSFVYLIFNERADLDRARSRIVESLSTLRAQLPEGVKTEIGPDASSLGWIYQYALVDSAGHHTSSELRSFQDWYLRYYLKSVKGVAEVAPIGGFNRQYQVNVDPNRLRAYGIGMSQVVNAVRDGNVETSGRLLEFGGTEYMVRGRGYARSLDDFRSIVVATPADGLPVRIQDLGEVVIGPDLRRGVADLDGTGDAVSGIIIMRNGENAVDVIDRVKAKLKETQAALPAGVKVVPLYDRSELIHRTIGNVQITIVEIVATVVLIILIFLWHFPSAIIPLITMPVVVLLSFIPLRLLGVSANVMSLAGIAIAFGELIDASIVVVEQSHKRLEQWEKDGRPGRQQDVVLGAVREVAGTIVFALLVIAVSVLPVFALESQEGRMFKPLAYSKAMAMGVAALMAMTLDPALRLLLTEIKRFHFRPHWLSDRLNDVFAGHIIPEDQHPISGLMMRLYEPVVRWTLRNRWSILASAALLVIATIPPFFSLGSEFMPPMNEGTILYMPSTMPGISVRQAQRLLLATDAILKQFPEVDHVLGKAGRAETPTDPAPLSMLETLISLKPPSEWRRIHTWYSAWAPHWLLPALRHITPDTISSEELVQQMNVAVQAPGVSNSWTMPIRGRIDMLTSGIRTPVGLKISGNNLQTIEDLGNQVQAALLPVRGTRGVFAERSNSGFFVDITWRRDQLARYGISVQQAQDVVNSAIGGDNVTTVFAGPERYPVSVRYMRDFRNSLDALSNVTVGSGAQRQVPLSDLATIQPARGPAMIRDENGLLTGYVYVDLADRDPGSYIAEASKVLQQHITTPPGFLISWSGQYEAMARVNKRLQFAIPLTITLIVLLIFFSTGSLVKTSIVLLAVPFSAIGAIWFLYLLGYNLSVAVWIGIIGLVAIDAETGVFMLLYLDIAYNEAMLMGRMSSLTHLREAIVQGAAMRLRPKFMTFATTCIGLFPIMWSVGAGSDVMKRIAAPMVGGIFTSFLLELLVYPILYEAWKRHSLEELHTYPEPTRAPDEALAFSMDGD